MASTGQLKANFCRKELHRTIWEVPKRYKNLKPISIGAFGQECSALDTSNGIEVTIKKLSRPFQTATHAKRAYRELYRLRHLNHENIISLLDVFCPTEHQADFDSVYIVTTGNLQSLNIILRNNELTDEHVQFLMYQIFRGLKYIHSAGIVHMNLKPTNFGVNEDCELSILNFTTGHKIGDNVVGYVATRYYMAPEVIVNRLPHGEKVDIWSVGCVMAELLTGQVLFPATDNLDQVQRFLQVCGTPDPEYIAKITDKVGRAYIQSLSHFPKKDFKCFFQGANPLAADLLEELLQWDPNKRPSAEMCLKHPYLAVYHDPDDELTCNWNYDSSFEDLEKSIDEWRQCVFDEIRNFTPSLQTFNRDETKCMEAYQHFLETKDSLELLFLKFLFVGPPRLGKTTLRRRLMGEIVDLTSAGEAERFHPSTGAVETGHNVVVKTVSNTSAVVTESEWSALLSLQDEACILFHNLVDTISSGTETATETSTETSTSTDKEVVVSETDGLDTTPPPVVVPDITSNQLENPAETDNESAISKSSSQSVVLPQRITEVSSIFKDAMKSAYWKDVKHLFKAHLRMEDTGGQPELMDMLPALTVGPGLYLLFISLENELDDLYKVSFCSSSGKSTIPVDSSYTVMEMLFSALSSICCSRTIPKSVLDSEESVPKLQNILELSHSVAYIVGTHKDKVSEERIRALNEQIKQKITSTALYAQDIIQFFSHDELIIALDNMNGGEEEIYQVRVLLEKAMEKHFKKLEIPAVWLLFSLCLRNDGRKIASLEFCLELSRKLNMSKYEARIAIWFLHHHAGVLMHFPNIPQLKDLVIIDNQIVYDSVTILILKAKNYEEVGHSNAEEFKKTGRFVLSHIVAATSKISGDIIPPLKLVALLEFLHIIARIPVSPELVAADSDSQEGDATYIMPCVLENATKQELDAISSRPTSIAPIMVYFTCGFVPIGVFPAMIACLIADNSFKLTKKDIKKNIVQFQFGMDYNLITLISRPQYYTVQVSRLSSSDSASVNEECVAIRKKIESTLQKVSSRMNYGSFMDYQFCFECPLHPDGDHLCEIKQTTECPRFMGCLATHDCPSPVPLSDFHRVWFNEVDSSASANTVCKKDMLMFKKVFPHLVSGLQSCINSLADHCWSEELISEDMYFSLMELNMTNAEKTRKLLMNVKQVISEKPDSLNKFCDVLAKVGGCEHLVKQMTK